MRVNSRSLMTLAIVSTISFPSVSEAKDPCESVICLAGKLQGGSGGSSCSGPISDYFSIVKFKKGRFKENWTKSARGAYLNSCAGAPPNLTSQINESYGSLRFGLF